MEKFFLRSFFIGKELDVIDQQRINGAVVAFKLFDRIVLQGFYHVLNEALGVHIHHFRIRLAGHNAVTHRVQQVRFTQTRAAIQEQRVVGASGVISNLTSRRARQLVRLTFNEVIERVLHVNVGAVGWLCRCRHVIPALTSRCNARGWRRSGLSWRCDIHGFTNGLGDGPGAHFKTQLRDI